MLCVIWYHLYNLKCEKNVFRTPILTGLSKLFKTTFAKKLNHRCLTRFCIRLWFLHMSCLRITGLSSPTCSKCNISLPSENRKSYIFYFLRVQKCYIGKSRIKTNFSERAPLKTSWSSVENDFRLPAVLHQKQWRKCALLE